MRSVSPEYSPVNGKTYSLFGNSDSTSGYYEEIRMLADKILVLNPDHLHLIDNIRKFSSKKRTLKKYLEIKDSSSMMADILNLIDPHLKKYTENTNEHLRTLPLSKFWDRRLATTREQYHLYMLEIELTNRLLVSEFLKADKKIALMPYCLQDFSVKCKSEKNAFDYQCKHCSAKCFQNHASTILKTNHIEPYIWMGGDMKQLAKYPAMERRSFGVLGIACIPELAWGMRNCCKNNIPVVGIPLNANRCVRWFGEFFPNSIDLIELERLVTSLYFNIA
ncbi:MAG: DUF116 domain-containing protein [Bacteroidales bacterium]|jgi:hypothetical protein